MKNYSDESQILGILKEYESGISVQDHLSRKHGFCLGVLLNTTPEVTDGFLTQESQPSTDFGMGFNLGLEYSFNDNIALGINAGWYQNTANFDGGKLEMSHLPINIRAVYSF